MKEVDSISSVTSVDNWKDSDVSIGEKVDTVTESSTVKLEIVVLWVTDSSLSVVETGIGSLIGMEVVVVRSSSNVETEDWKGIKVDREGRAVSVCSVIVVGRFWSVESDSASVFSWETGSKVVEDVTCSAKDKVVEGSVAVWLEKNELSVDNHSPEVLAGSPVVSLLKMLSVVGSSDDIVAVSVGLIVDPSPGAMVVTGTVTNSPGEVDIPGSPASVVDPTSVANASVDT